MNERSSLDSLVPDPAAIERYLSVLFGFLGGLVSLRLFSEVGTPSQPAVCKAYPANSDELRDAVLKSAEWAPQKQRGVFVVPGIVASGATARAADVVASGVLLIDLDAGDIVAKRDLLERHLGSATLVVASGGCTAEGQAKLHLYWRLTEAAVGDDLVELGRLRAKIAEDVGGDASFGSMHQPIRVAGTVHGKNGVKTRARIVEDRALEYELRDLTERVAEMPIDPRLKGARSRDDRRAKSSLSTDALMLTSIHAGGADEETRFSALSRIIGHWLRMVRTQRVTLDEAWRAVVDYNAARIEPAWPEDRLRREFLALLHRDEATRGPMPDPGSTYVNAGPPPLSEDALAAALAALHGEFWRHVAAWGAWMRWSGSRWVRDDTNAIRETVRQVCRARIPPETKDGEARRIASERTIRAVERIAAADPSIAARVGDWDAHPLLLNTRSGIVDLQTGEVLPHDPGRMLTQMTAASVGSTCARWLQFLDEVTSRDSDLVAYLARFCGYCLSGSTEEHVFAFFHGSGANGKSVFLQAVSQVLGTYAATAPSGTFMATRSDAHPTDLAGLVGRRLVTVAETESGRAWAEARIKTITGGDPIRARFMNRDFFEFTPTFKIAAAGNHRPRLTGVGEAMRRRMHLIPFTVTIPAERRNKRLLEDLLKERDGILAWMIAGHADWRDKGLAPPAAVLQSGEEYFDDEDLVGQWIDARCVQGPQHRATSCDLYRNWKQWAETAGAEFGSQKSLGDALRGRGFTSGKVARERGWVGIAVRMSARAQGPEE